MTKTSLADSFIIALRGIYHAISNERNMKIQIAIGFLAIVIALLLRIPKIEFIIILSVVFLVIILEMLNISVEKIIDLVYPYYDEKAGKIKDIMAGAVLLAAVLSVIIGLLILLKPLIAILASIEIFIIIDVVLFFIIALIAYLIIRNLY